MTEGCLIIRGEEKSLETKGAEVPAAARLSEPHHTPRIALWVPGSLGRTATGLPVGEAVKPRTVPGTAGPGHGPEASWLALPCPALLEAPSLGPL